MFTNDLSLAENETGAGLRPNMDECNRLSAANVRNGYAAGISLATACIGEGDLLDAQNPSSGGIKPYNRLKIVPFRSYFSVGGSQ